MPHDMPETEAEFTAALSALLDGNLGEAPTDVADTHSETEGHQLHAPEGSLCADDPIFTDADENEVDMVMAVTQGALYYGNVPMPILRTMKMMTHQKFHEAEEGSREKQALKQTFILIAAVETVREHNK